MFLYWNATLAVTPQQLEEENKQIRQEKEDLESEVLSHTSKTAESEITSLKRMKRDMELKIEELEDELDEVNLKWECSQDIISSCFS